MNKIHFLSAVQSVVAILVSINRLDGWTLGYVLPNEFLRWVDFNNMLVLPLISLAAFYLLKKTIEFDSPARDGRTHMTWNLVFIIGLYLLGASYGDHEVTNYLHHRFCLEDTASDLCRIVIFNDDEFSHWVFFTGFIMVNAALLFLQNIFPPGKELSGADIGLLSFNRNRTPICPSIGVLQSLNQNSAQGEREMNYLVITLRIIHIVAGIFWVGGTLIMTFFIGPTIGATAEAGQKFVGHLMNNLKFSSRMSAAAGLTIAAGAILYWIDSQGFTSAWTSSGPGRGFLTGAGFALIGFIFGILIGRTTKAMAQIGAQFQGKPSAEQMAQIQSLRKQQATYSSISAAALILAVILMAIARYLVF